MLQTSQNTEKLDNALSKAQGELKNATLDKVNPFFKSKYADLSTVLLTVRPVLSANGISISQWPTYREGSNLVHLVTRVACGGQWMLSESALPSAKKDAHGYAAAITYLKRISLSAIIGVSFEEDDDGNATIPPKQAKANQAPQKVDPTKIVNAFKALGYDRQHLETYVGKPLEQLTKADSDSLKKYYKELIAL